MYERRDVAELSTSIISSSTCRNTATYHSSGATVEYRVTFLSPGTYPIQVKAEDTNGAQSDFSPILIVTITSGVNHPPDKPDRPSGEMNGRVGHTYTYYSRTTDPDGDQVYYKFSWGDGTSTGWLGPYSSGSTVSASHTWTSWGTYDIKVKAKDIHGNESSWSDPLPVTMPRGRIFDLLLGRFTEECFLVLRQILLVGLW
ncbi:MAG TPA: PKD domain-containing protein [Thermoplasmatales archaeon]|nr:PKD domain-containing protein [Thermoplasmatales archaeon]